MPKGAKKFLEFVKKISKMPVLWICQMPNKNYSGYLLKNVMTDE